MDTSKELQAREKQEVSSPAERTSEGVVFTPAVDIFESERDIMMLADMPGVKADDVNIDIKDDVLTISGDVKPWEDKDETDVRIEFEIGRYERQFTLSESIDQEKIEAKMKDGVLHLNLPKAAKAVPRKIEVKSG